MIEIDNISKWYSDFQVLKGCTTKVAKGEVVVVCGPSGSGKSTLIQCVNGLEPFQQGDIRIEGVSVGDRRTDLPKLRARVGMVFQHFELFPHLTVIANLCLAQMKVLGRGREEATKKTMALLDRVGLKEQAPKYPGQLSGGQQQRVAIARSLINNPRIILADEPTGALDSRTSIEIMAIFQRLNREQGISIIVVTHEPDISRYADRIISFKDGRIVSDEPVHDRLDAEHELQGEAVAS
jgi:glutamate/aspartate transport system ATP-binding protein